MRYINKISHLFLFITVLLLCLSIVSAQENNDTHTIIKEEQTTTSQVIKEETKPITKTKIQEKNITKTDKNNIKTASKKATYFDIKITNNIANDAKIEIGVRDVDNKLIPNSKLELTLPDKTKINTKTQKNGWGTVTMKLASGNKTIHIDYPGTDKYYAYDYDLKMEVFKRNSNMNINIEKTNDTGDVNITVKLTDSITGNNIKNAKLTLKTSDGRTFTETTNNNAVAKFDFKLNSGKNYMNLTYPGNTIYSNVKTNLTVDMGKIKNNVDYDVELNNLYVGQTSLSVTLKDYVTRKTLPNTQIQLKIHGGKTYTGKTNNKGVFTTKVEAPVGKNYMDLTYNGNSKYNNRTATINFTVTKRVSDMNFTLTSPTNPKLSITLKDIVLNKTINNAPVTITLPDGQKITRNTNTKGQITYPITVEEGNKKYRATYNGNTNQTSITKTLTVSKEAEKIPVTYNVTVTNKIYRDDIVIFKLIDTKTKKAIPNAPLTIKLPLKTVTAKTNKQGEITVTKSLKVGTNKATISYKGNSKYANRTTTVDIKIDKRPSTIDSSIHMGTSLGISLTLKDAINNKTIPNAKLVLKHPKTNVTLTTDKNGKVSEDIKLPAGKAEISLRYAGNSVYSASSVKPTNITITDPKTATKVTINSVKGTLGDKIRITVNVKDIKGNNINNGNVILKLNGKTLKTDNIFGSKKAAKKLLVKNGKATVTLTATKTIRNAKNLTATYGGTSKYHYNVSKAIKPQIQLRKAQITVTATPKIQQQHKVITFKVNIKDESNKKIADKNSYVIFKINGKTLKDSKSKTIKVQVKNQTATYKYRVPKGTSGLTTEFKVKNHVLTAVFSNPVYSSAKNTTKFQVKRSSTKFNITTLQYTNKTRTLTIKGNIKDYMNTNVAGNTKINIKIDGKSITQAGKTVNYTIKSGKINLNIKVPNTFKTVNKVTLTSGNRLAYTKATFVSKVKHI